MKILITGAAGFVCGDFFRKTAFVQSEKKRRNKLAQTDTLVGVDLFKTCDVSAMYWNNNHPVYPANILDAHIIDIIFQREKPDIVIHGAAETSVDRSLQNSAEFYATNVIGTKIIVKACLKYQVKKIIYLSTDQVYGQLISENDVSWTESSSLNPHNPYASSKAEGELIIKASGLTYNIIRSSDCYGYRQLPEKFIPKTIQCIQRETQNIPIYGQGLQMRDWIYVDDYNAALTTILEKGLPNEIYNVGANQEFSNLEVVNLICNVMGRGHSLINFIDDPRKLTHDFRYAMNCSKIKALDWKPNYKLKDGLAETVEKYEINKWFLR